VPALALFPAHYDGEYLPLSYVSGGNTLLLRQTGLSLKGLGFDPAGNMWVPNDGGTGGYLTSFSPEANGNVAPLNTIGYSGLGRAQGLIQPADIKFDAAGNMFVANTSTVLVFSPPFSDSSVPIATWSIPDHGWAWYMAFDEHGNLYAMSDSTI
jgi:hypothetical protein